MDKCIVFDYDGKRFMVEEHRVIILRPDGVDTAEVIAICDE